MWPRGAFDRQLSRTRKPGSYLLLSSRPHNTHALQLLFEGSEESGGCEGLGLIPGTVTHFDTSKGLPVPHIGWNDLIQK